MVLEQKSKLIVVVLVIVILILGAVVVSQLHHLSHGNDQEAQGTESTETQVTEPAETQATKSAETQATESTETRPTKPEVTQATKPEVTPAAKVSGLSAIDGEAVTDTVADFLTCMTNFGESTLDLKAGLKGVKFGIPEIDNIEPDLDRVTAFNNCIDSVESVSILKTYQPETDFAKFINVDQMGNFHYRSKKVVVEEITGQNKVNKNGQDYLVADVIARVEGEALLFVFPSENIPGETTNKISAKRGLYNNEVELTMLKNMGTRNWFVYSVDTTFTAAPSAFAFARGEDNIGLQTYQDLGSVRVPKD